MHQLWLEAWVRGSQWPGHTLSYSRRNSLTFLFLVYFVSFPTIPLQLIRRGQRGFLRSRQTSRWYGARGWSCPALSSTTLALSSGPKMAWLWALGRTCRVRHHTASLGVLQSVRRVTKMLFHSWLWYIMIGTAHKQQEKNIFSVLKKVYFSCLFGF